MRLFYRGRIAKAMLSRYMLRDAAKNA